MGKGTRRKRSPANTVVDGTTKKPRPYQHLDLQDISTVPVPATIITTVRETKPPPITLPLQTAATVKSYLSTAGIATYSCKNMSIGVKVFVETKADRAKLMAHLEGEMVNFFTFASKDEKLQKFVLNGLCRMETAELLKELNALGIYPFEISPMKLQRTKWIDDVPYLVQFNKDKPTTLEQLQKIYVVNYTRVTWKSYKPINKGHTQCRRCQGHGHGSSHCHVSGSCMFCASKDHLTINCSFQADVIKHLCINCKGNHPANSPSCPLRLQYLAIREKMNPRQTPTSKQTPTRLVPAPAPPPLTQSFAMAARPRPVIQQNPFSPGPAPMLASASPRNPAAPTPASDPNALPSMAEVSAFIANIIPRVMACRTRGDMLQTILNIVCEYAIQP